jgi:uncharacterized membrane protein
MTFSNLDHPIRWLFLAHAVAGALALAILFVPLVTKKGGRIHMRAGWIYAAAMIFVAASAFVITPWRILFDPARSTDSVTFSVFLFYISVFTVTALSHGISSLRAKSRLTASRSGLHLGPPLATLLVGLIAQAIGFKEGSLLLMIFPFLGHATAAKQLRYWLRAPRERMHWWYAHMDGMFVACIATITAFLVTALPRLWAHSMAQSPILWVAPGLILGTAADRWVARYRKKFEARMDEDVARKGA